MAKRGARGPKPAPPRKAPARRPLLVKLNLLGIVFFIALTVFALFVVAKAAVYGEEVPAWPEPFGMLAGTIAVALAAFHFGVLGLKKEE